LPESPELADALGGRIAGDDGRVDGTDGDARHPVGMDAGCGKRLVDAGLVGAEGAAALKDERDALERKTLLAARCAGPCSLGQIPLPSRCRRHTVAWHMCER